LKIYQFLSIIFYPFLELYIFYRVYKNKEDKKRVNERFGISKIDRSNQEVIWIHAVSVGEVNSALSLIDEIEKKHPQYQILFTTTTLTSAQILAEKIINSKIKITHQYLPIDSLFCVKNFLNFWRPKIAIFVESEIWPNFIFQCYQNQIKTFLINARLSEESIRRWKWAKFFGFNIFSYFDEIFAQSEQDKINLEKLTGKNIHYLGNLKSQISQLKINHNLFSQLKNQISDRKIFLSASTHQGEEEIILKTHQKLKKEFKNLLTIIIPRHPNRRSEIINLAKNLLFSENQIAIRSKNQEISAEIEFYLVDSLGELATFYQLADFTFLGGSMTQVGGHTPFEPIELECAVISGKYFFNNRQIFENLHQNKGCIIIDDENDLYQQVKTLLLNEEISSEVNQNAKKIIQKNTDIASRIIEKLMISSDF
jgi:3-deoxy-D-manno-octulosonic-acid transferase